MEFVKNYILKELEILDSKRKRIYDVKYTNEYYINMMMYLFNDVNNWKFLKNIDGYGNKIQKELIPKYHYKIIENKK